MMGVLAVILGILALACGVLATFLFGTTGAIVAGALALVLAVSMTFASVGTLKLLKETAAKSGVAPTFARYMDNPYLGLSSVVSNAVNASNDGEAVKTIEKELEALKQYEANAAKPATENAPVAG